MVGLTFFFSVTVHLAQSWAPTHMVMNSGRDLSRRAPIRQKKVEAQRMGWVAENNRAIWENHSVRG